MKYKSLTIDNQVITSYPKIERKLLDLNFYWLIDSELENAEIEIKNKTLIWYNGQYITGNWPFGIFKNGDFYGNFINGIWEGGNFQGTGNPPLLK